MLALPFTRHLALGVAALCMLLVSAGVVIGAQGLSGRQVVARDLGHFSWLAGYGTASIAPGDDAREQIGRSLEEQGVAARVGLSVGDFTYPPLGQRPAFFKEMSWERSLTSRYADVSGRWPRAAGEVLLVNTTGEKAGLRPGERVDVLGGRFQLRVVGTARDPYSERAALLAGPGTWAALPAESARGNDFLDASPLIYGSGSLDETTLRAVAEAIRGSDATPVPGFRSELESSVRTRADMLADSDVSWLLRSPAGFLIPALLVPPILAGVVFGAMRRRHGSLVERLLVVGAPQRAVRWTWWRAISIAVLAAASAGCAVGLLTGQGIAVALAHLKGGPAAELRSPWVPVITVMGSLIAGLLALSPALRVARRRRTTRRAAASAARIEQADVHRRAALRRHARHVVGAALLAAATWLGVRVASPVGAVVMMALLSGATVALMPDIARVVIERLPERGPRSRLAIRQLLTEVPRTASTIAVLAIVLTLAVGFLSLLSTMIRTVDAQAYPPVLPGQIKIADRSTDTAPIPGAVRRATLGSAPLVRAEPIPLRFVGRQDDDFTTRVAAEGFSGLIFATSSAEELAHLTHASVPAQARRVLRAGGVLVWDRQPGAVPREMRLEEVSAGPSRTLATVPAARIDVPLTGWNVGTTGVMLERTARKLGLPVATGAVLYDGVTDQESAQVVNRLIEAGVDPLTAQVYQEPPPPVPPAALVLSAVLLAVLALAAMTLATAANARSLTRNSERLVALGLSPLWAQGVIVQQMLIMLVVAIVVMLPVAALPVLAAVVAIPGFELSIPFGQVSTVLAAVVAATVLSAYLATAKVRAAAR